MRVSVLSRLAVLHTGTGFAFAAASRSRQRVPTAFAVHNSRTKNTISRNRSILSVQRRRHTTVLCSSGGAGEEQREDDTVVAASPVVNRGPGPSSAAPLLRLLGGEYAGVSAQCDPVTGQAKPVPVYLVPPSLLEWGQHPRALEVIVSEDPIDVDTTVDENARESSSSWNRVCLTVLPETGCGVDNLEVQKRTEQGWRVVSQSSDSCIGLVRQAASKNGLVVETVFDVTERDQSEPHRLRLTVTMVDGTESSSFSSISDVVLSYERRLDVVSSRGTRADGGGLDGASVARWMGPAIARKGVSLLEAAVPEAPRDHPPKRRRLVLPAGVTLECESGEGDDFTTLLRVSHTNGQSLQYRFKMDCDWESIEVMST